MNRQKSFRELLPFRKDSREKPFKMCVRVVNDYADTWEIILILKKKKNFDKSNTNLIWNF